MADIDFIMERIGPGRGAENFKLWACRGEGKGCNRNRFRKQKRHCEDCVATEDDQTLGEIREKIARGDA